MLYIYMVSLSALCLAKVFFSSSPLFKLCCRCLLIPITLTHFKGLSLLPLPSTRNYSEALLMLQLSALCCAILFALFYSHLKVVYVLFGIVVVVGT